MASQKAEHLESFSPGNCKAVLLKLKKHSFTSEARGARELSILPLYNGLMSHPTHLKKNFGSFFILEDVALMLF